MKNNTLFENHTPKQLLEICSELYEQEKYEDIINILENITDYVSEDTDDGDDISLIFTLSMSYVTMGDRTEENIYHEKNIKLLNYFEGLLDFAEELEEFLWHLLIGQSYYSLDNLKKALLHLEISFRLRPDDINCNFHLAEVYRLLEQEPKALEHYQRLLELNEDDEMSELIDDEMNEVIIEHIKLCLLKLSQPHFQESFKQRVERTWKIFEEQEEVVRQLIDEYETIEDEYELEEFFRNELLPVIDRILTIEIQNPYFESKKENGKYHLYLSTMGFYERIPLYAYFISKMPESLHQYWNIELGLPMKDELKMYINEEVIQGNEFSLWVEEVDEELSVSMFSEKLVSSIKEDEMRAYALMLKLIIETLGEVAVAILKEVQGVDFKLLRKPLKIGERSSENQAISLYELQETLEEKGYIVLNDLEKYLQLTCSYEKEPKEMDDDWQFRDDIKYSLNRMPELELFAYEDNDSSIFDAFYSMGVVTGFFSLPAEKFMKNDMESMKQLEELVQSLLAYIEENAGSDVITIIGKSVGVYCVYIDFIAWDINVVLETAHNFFKETEFDWVNYHSYRADTNVIRLYEK